MPLRCSRLASLSALCAAALGGATCSEPATAPDDVNSLRVVASVQPAETRVGQPVTLTLAVTNTGPGIRLLITGCEDAFTLTDSSGAALPTAERLCIGGSAPVDVWPGQQVVLTRVWYGDVGPTTRGFGVALPPGEYRLRAFVRSFGRPPRDGDTSLLRDVPATYAEPVSVRILPR